MVRLVFRPYTQFRRSICTSESLRTSIRVSPDFILTRHSSPSFGSQRVCSRCTSFYINIKMRCPGNANLYYNINYLPINCINTIFTFITPLGLIIFIFHKWKIIPMTCIHVRLLGPCFKTGPESTQSNSIADRYFF